MILLVIGSALRKKLLRERCRTEHLSYGTPPVAASVAPFSHPRVVVQFTY